MPNVGGSEDAPTAGTLVGGYRLEELVGEGGMGHVFRAVRESDGETVALKVLKHGLSADPQHGRRFQREARAAAEVEHRHLVPVLDIGEDDGRRYLAMRYVPGSSLERWIEDDGPLGIPETVRITRHVASALDALHAAGVLHRDIKAANILIEADGSAVLTDFGLAKATGYSELTRPGQLMGTLDYLAPERLRGEEPDSAADVYALGCVVYECIAGTTPFGGRSVFELGMAVLGEEPPDPCAERSDAPAGLSRAVMMALEKDPAKRPPTATTYANLLAVAARQPAG